MELPPYDEFYITTNPPLLPEGVRSAIAHVREQIGDKIMEILYDPEGPWFKVIADRSHKDEVYSTLQSYLAQRLQEQTVSIDDDLTDGPIGDQNAAGPSADIEVIGDEPHFIPWVLYEAQNLANSVEYDGFRFPSPIQKLPFKRVWRGLENYDELTILELLKRFDHLHPNLIPERIGDLTHCEVTYNMRGDLVYVGSIHGTSNLDAAVRKLETLLHLQDSINPGPSHMIFAERESPPDLSFRYFTHLGLDKMTYTDAQVLGMTTDNDPPLTHLATVRTNVINGHGVAELDNSVYVRVSSTSVNFRPSIDPFVNFLYPTKSCGYLPHPESDHRSPPPRSHGDTPAQSQVARTPSERHQTLLKQEQATSDADVDLYAATERSGHDTGKSPRRESWLQGPGEADMVNFSSDSKHVGKSEMDVIEVAADSMGAQMSPADRVVNWVAGVEAAGASKLTDFSSHLAVKKANSLLDGISSLGGVQACFGGPSPGRVEPAHDSRGEAFNINNSDVNQGDDLIQVQVRPHGHVATLPKKIKEPSKCLLDSDSPPRLTYGRFFPMDLVSQRQRQTETQNELRVTCPQPYLQKDEEHLMDSSIDHIQTPALLDTLVPQSTMTVPTIDKTRHFSVLEDQCTNTVPIFQKAEEGKKECFETMRQQASPGKSWAQIASGKGDKMKKQDTLFGVNIPVRTIQKTSRPPRSVSPSKRALSQTRLAGEDTPVSPTKKPMPMPGTQGPSAQLSQTKALRKLKAVSQVINDAQAPVVKMLEILQIAPGELKLEATLGRIGITNLHPSLVATTHALSWDQERVQECLENNVEQFYTALTTNGAEIELLPLMINAKGQPWVCYDQNVYYDIIYRHNDGDEITAELEGSNLQYVCRPPSQSLSNLYIHCPRRAWDIRIGVTRTDNTLIPDGFKEFAGTSLKSLSISREQEGHVRLEAAQDAKSPWKIERAQVRHVAKYRGSPGSQTYLAITMTRAVRGFESKGRWRGVTRPVSAPGENPVSQWFEAAIGNTRAEHYFKENSTLEFGDRTSWTPDQLVKDGIIKAICEPALQLVTQMDRIGQTNDNGESLKLGPRCRGASSEQKAGYQFW